MNAVYQLRPFLRLALRAGREPRLYRSLFGGPAAGEQAANITLWLPSWWRQEGLDPRNQEYLSGTHQRIPWRCSIGRDSTGRWQTRFTSPIFRAYLGFHIALLPLICEELNRMRETLLIGAAFHHGGEVTALLGRSGSGKTRTMLRAVERGALPVADEYFSVSTAGAACPLLHVVGLRENVRRQAPRLYGALPPRLKVALSALRVTGLFMHPPLLLHATWADVGVTAPTPEKAKIARVWWLDSTLRGRQAQRLAPTELAQRALAHLSAHDRWYRPRGGPVSLGDDANVREILVRAFSTVECYAGSPETVPIEPPRSFPRRERVG